jgi:hypothetical protein
VIIEYKGWGSLSYYTVEVGKDEVKTRSGKYIPCTWLGTISTSGKINLWRPAGYCPRDYKPRAMELLELAKRRILEEQDKLDGPVEEGLTIEIPAEQED